MRRYVTISLFMAELSVLSFAQTNPRVIEVIPKAVAGAIMVYAGQSGTLSIDGYEATRLRANGSAIVYVNTAGTYELTMYFDAGAQETLKVDVQTDTPVSAGFGYAIGDYGPGGGRIFYVKEQYSEGWRYLECASYDVGSTQWGLNGADVSGTGTQLGTGKQNSRLLLDRMYQAGERNRAVQHCATYNEGGFTDWFLPSKNELDLIYRNLHTDGYVTLTDNYYWSSSQYNDGYVWCQLFQDGAQGYGSKNYTFCVRPIRSF
ncbi:MAG: DUF1566 domain-containing protein [Treponema sp.]|nr:DUF1566 domain-containing protein [Treponema sp.]